MSAKEREWSSLGVHDDTKRRFDQMKPYDSMSHDDWLGVLLDKWEGKR